MSVCLYWGQPRVIIGKLTACDVARENPVTIIAALHTAAPGICVGFHFAFVNLCFLFFCFPPPPPPPPRCNCYRGSQPALFMSLTQTQLLLSKDTLGQGLGTAGMSEMPVSQIAYKSNEEFIKLFYTILVISTRCDQRLLPARNLKRLPKVEEYSQLVGAAQLKGVPISEESR